MLDFSIFPTSLKFFIYKIWSDITGSKIIYDCTIFLVDWLLYQFKILFKIQD